MRRREFITLLGGAASTWPLAASAQGPAMLRVGAVGTQPRVRSFLQGFDTRMRELGYVEGQNFAMDYVDLQGRVDRYDEAMQQLVDRHFTLIRCHFFSLSVLP